MFYQVQSYLERNTGQGLQSRPDPLYQNQEAGGQGRPIRLGGNSQIPVPVHLSLQDTAAEVCRPLTAGLEKPEALKEHGQQRICHV